MATIDDVNNVQEKTQRANHKPSALTLSVENDILVQIGSYLFS
jgi:hypothetical protein